MALFSILTSNSNLGPTTLWLLLLPLRSYSSLFTGDMTNLLKYVPCVYAAFYSRVTLACQTCDMGENCLIPSQAIVAIPALLFVNGILGYFKLQYLAYFQRLMTKIFCIEFFSIVYRPQIKGHVKRRLQLPDPLQTLVYWNVANFRLPLLPGNILSLDSLVFDVAFLLQNGSS